MRLVQFFAADNARRVGVVQGDGDTLRVLAEPITVRDLALEADRTDSSLESLIDGKAGDETAILKQLLDEKRVLPPLDHPDPAHCFVTGTGLTHLGSAKARDEMHDKMNEQAASENVTDSMQIFQWGYEGGKPEAGQISVQPEWFYKGSGLCVVPPEHPLPLPQFADDGGEEAELTGLYVIGESGNVLRVGFALGNEYSDHVMERKNYLYLAHSKLRACSFGPELLVGEAPADIQGTVRIVRDGNEVWSAPFLTGEDNMTYYLSQLEHHHFKYDLFRQPGDIHCHFFGTATLSFTAGVSAKPDDVFEISASGFGMPLRNPLQAADKPNKMVTIKTL